LAELWQMQECLEETVTVTESPGKVLHTLSGRTGKFLGDGTTVHLLRISN